MAEGRFELVTTTLARDTSFRRIWVETYVASVTYFPHTERRVNSPDGRGRRGEKSCVDRWRGEGSLKAQKLQVRQSVDPEAA
jgi:hypothetical protein